MKAGIHPDYKDLNVTCSCGHTFVTRSTMGKDAFHVGSVLAVPPVLHRQAKVLDTAGRIDKFKQKFGKFAR